MNNFHKSILSGIRAAETAASVKKEVNEIINLIAKQVEGVSAGKATFGIGEFHKSSISQIVIGAQKVTEANNFFIGSGTYRALGIFDKNNGKGIELARWSDTNNGYPCKISFNDTDTFCYNRQELESALDELLSQVHTGEAILSKIESST